MEKIVTVETMINYLQKMPKNTKVFTAGEGVHDGVTDISHILSSTILREEDLRGSMSRLEEIALIFQEILVINTQ